MRMWKNCADAIRKRMSNENTKMWRIDVHDNRDRLVDRRWYQSDAAMRKQLKILKRRWKDWRVDLRAEAFATTCDWQQIDG